MPGEYLKKARNTDIKYGGTQEGEMGNIERKLTSFGRVRGLVVGSWSELSSDFKDLLTIMAESRKKISEMQHSRGRHKSDQAQHAKFISQQRQQLSRVCVQAQSRLLLDRLEGLGGGAGEAAKRRSWAGYIDREVEREHQAQLIAARQGTRVYRAGDFLLH